MRMEVPRLLQAQCARPDVDAEWFFMDDMRTNGLYETRLAKRYCNQCVHQQECLSYALRENILFGVWGGFTSAERKDLRKKVIMNVD